MRMTRKTRQSRRIRCWARLLHGGGIGSEVVDSCVANSTVGARHVVIITFRGLQSSLFAGTDGRHRSGRLARLRWGQQGWQSSIIPKEHTASVLPGGLVEGRLRKRRTDEH